MKKETLSQQAAKRDQGKEQLGKRSGDHVFISQDRAVKEGFRNVSRTWFEKCTPLANVLERVVSDSEECSDLDVTPDALRVQEDGTITHEGESLTLSRRAAKHLCTMADMPGALAGPKLFEAGDPEAMELFARLMNRGMEKNHSEREKNWKLRLRGTEVRAIVTQDYAAISNEFTATVLDKIAPGGYVSHMRYDGDTLSGLLLISDTIREEKDSDYGGGIHFRNSEVAESRFSTLPAVFRSICMNGCIWGQLQGQEAGTEAIHRGQINLNVLALLLEKRIKEQIPVTSTCIQTMLDAKQIDFNGSVIACIGMIAKLEKGLSKETRKAWLKGWLEEGMDTNAFGLVQGLTATARDTMSPDLAIHLEKAAGSLISRSSAWWKTESNYALKVDDKELLDVFGETALANVLG